MRYIEVALELWSSILKIPVKELLKQGVKGLQAFAFCVVAVNGKDTERQKKG